MSKENTPETEASNDTDVNESAKNGCSRRSALAASAAALAAVLADTEEAQAAPGKKMRIETPKDERTAKYVGYVQAIVKKAMTTKREDNSYYDQIMWAQVMINELAFHILFDEMQKNDCGVFMRNIMEGFKGPAAKDIATMMESWAASRDGFHNTMVVRDPYFYKPADPSTHYLKDLSHQPPFDSKVNLTAK